MRALSVDPGKAGAIVLQESGDKILDIWDTELVKVGSKTMVDLHHLAAIAQRSSPDVIIVEKVGASPRAGSASMFSFGYSFGGVVGVAAGAGIPCVTITPQKWKTYFGLIGKDKDAARTLTIEMLPGLASQFKLKKHVDRADALLLGLAWLRLNHDKKL